MNIRIASRRSANCVHIELEFVGLSVRSENQMQSKWILLAAFMAFYSVACSDDNKTSDDQSSVQYGTGGATPINGFGTGGIAGTEAAAGNGPIAGSTSIIQGGADASVGDGSITTQPPVTNPPVGGTGAVGGTSGTPADSGLDAAETGTADTGTTDAGVIDPNVGTDPLPPLPIELTLPIVFVHGFAGSGEQYQSMAMRFVANGYPIERIRAYDHDGAGMDLVGYADGLDQLIDEVLAEFSVSQVYLVGHSRGTFVSSSYLGDPTRAAPR